MRKKLKEEKKDMRMYTNPDTRSIWKKRADRVGFQVWKGKDLQDMTDEEIQKAFDGLQKECGIGYIWA